MARAGHTHTRVSLRGPQAEAVDERAARVCSQSNHGTQPSRASPAFYPLPHEAPDVTQATQVFAERETVTLRPHITSLPLLDLDPSPVHCIWLRARLPLSRGNLLSPVSLLLPETSVPAHVHCSPREPALFSCPWPRAPGSEASLGCGHQSPPLPGLLQLRQPHSCPGPVGTTVSGCFPPHSTSTKSCPQPCPSGSRALAEVTGTPPCAAQTAAGHGPCASEPPVCGTWLSQKYLSVGTAGDTGQSTSPETP